MSLSYNERQMVCDITEVETCDNNHMLRQFFSGRIGCALCNWWQDEQIPDADGNNNQQKRVNP